MVLLQVMLVLFKPPMPAPFRPINMVAVFLLIIPMLHANMTPYQSTNLSYLLSLVLFPTIYLASII